MSTFNFQNTDIQVLLFFENRQFTIDKQTLNLKCNKQITFSRFRLEIST